MDKGIFTAVTSINSEKRREINNVHHLSNVSTIGFKKAFQASIDTIRVDGPGNKTRFMASSKETGLVDMTPGPKMFTGNPLDIYMDLDTVLGVFNREGALAFTRRGDMRVSNEGQLILATGELVAGEDGNPIDVPQDMLLSVSPEGIIYSQDPAEEVAEQEEVGRLLLRDASETPLRKMRDGLFTADGQDGGDFETGPLAVSVTSEMLEGSSSSAMDVMVQMMAGQRSFEMKMKLISQFMDLSETNNTMMRLA